MENTAEKESPVIFHLSSYKEVGESHIARGKDCEDSVRTGTHPVTGVAAAVVCDGAGSCSHAKEGSAATAAAALELLLAQFDELYDLSMEAFAEIVLECIRELLAAKAEELECELESLSSTLVCAAMAPDGRYLYFHVGDGVIACMDMQGKCRVLSQYYHEIAPNFTTFVTIPGTEYNYGKGQGDLAGFLLTSDGPEYFMTYDGWMTANAGLLLQLNCMFPEEYIITQLEGLTTFFKQCGMYDDASYALIGDRRRAGDIFAGMEPDMRSIVFDMPRQLPGRVIEQYQAALNYAALSGEDGIPESQLARLMHVHSSKNVMNKMERLISCGLVRYQNGRYYF